MFDLEQAIQTWREQMLTSGITAPEPMDELECHLRDEIEERLRTGAAGQQAFEAAILRVGNPPELRSEFKKLSESRIKHCLLTVAGIPAQYVMPMSNTNETISLEPRWATYAKTTMFLAPPLGLWAITAIFVFPKLQWICQEAGIKLPIIYQMVNVLTRNALWIGVVLIAGLILLEWHSTHWPHYRRAILGIAVFILNSAVLLLITSLVVLAVMAAPALLQHGK